MNPWGVQVWGEIALNNELYGLTEDQLYLDELAEYEETKEMRQELDQMKKGEKQHKQSGRDEKSPTITFSPDVIKQGDK